MGVRVDGTSDWHRRRGRRRARGPRMCGCCIMLVIFRGTLPHVPPPSLRTPHETLDGCAESVHDADEHGAMHCSAAIAHAWSGRPRRGPWRQVGAEMRRAPMRSRYLLAHQLHFAKVWVATISKRCNRKTATHTCRFDRGRGAGADGGLPLL